MYMQNIPMGPDKAPAPTAKPDRTNILDPKEFWPDILQCPDWPVVGITQSFDGQRGKAGAEARLETIGLHLNRGATSLRAPTADERLDEFARTFRRNGTNMRWYAIGINNLTALGMMAEADADLMVEACHLRAYIRKVEAVAIRDAERAADQRKSEARRALEEYRATVPGYVEEIASLADAVARHNQRIEDEKAERRTRYLRDHAQTLHSVAVQAAHTLGLGVPDAPQILD